MNGSSDFGRERIPQQYVMLYCLCVVVCAVLAEDAIRAALNNYKTKKKSKAAAANAN